VDQAVCETLANLVEESPRQVADCLARVVDNDVSHRTQRCANAIRKNLEALRAGPASDASRKIAARLVARKYPEFSDRM
jgi:hypothetical protein